MNKTFYFLLAISAILLFTSISQAQVPNTLSYQGVLTDTLGHPRADGVYSFTFRIYSSSTNGTAIWSETKNLTLSHGLFTTFLGDVVPIKLEFNVPYWLSIQVSGDQELTPRIPLSSVGYSFHTVNADTATYTNFTDSSRVAGTIPINSVSTAKIANSAISRDKIADSAITSSKISKGQVVKTLNGLADNITLNTTGGATITKNGNTLTINAGSGSGSAGIQSLQNTNNTLDIASPNGPTATVNIKNKGVGTDQLADGSVTTAKLNSSGASSGQVLKFNGTSVSWGSDDIGGLTLPFSSTTSSSEPLLSINNTGYAEAGLFTINNNTNSLNALNGIILNGTGNGVYGESLTKSGVYGYSKSGNGVLGTSDNSFGIQGAGGLGGVYGTSSILGVRGSATATFGTTYGVHGIASSPSGAGVFGINTSSGGIGVLGSSSSGIGISGTGITGVYALSDGSSSSIGILGVARGSKSVAIQASGENYGLWGTGNNIGVYAHNGSGTPGRDVYLSTSNLAADMYGDVYVHGNITKSGGSFKIDDPLDPANKYLYHSFVESPDMKNIYDGVVVLDAQGEATVQLPDWFEALNRDFRYQLTAIGGPGPNLYISSEINNNQFRIAGGSKGMKVSWMVTGIRHDAWANAHRIPVEVDKKPEERGFYEHPELFGQPENKSIINALHPETTQMKADGKIIQEKINAIDTSINSQFSKGETK